MRKIVIKRRKKSWTSTQLLRDMLDKHSSSDRHSFSCWSTLFFSFIFIRVPAIRTLLALSCKRRVQWLSFEPHLSRQTGSSATAAGSGKLRASKQQSAPAKAGRRHSRKLWHVPRAPRKERRAKEQPQLARTSNFNDTRDVCTLQPMTNDSVMQFVFLMSTELVLTVTCRRLSSASLWRLWAALWDRKSQHSF